MHSQLVWSQHHMLAVYTGSDECFSGNRHTVLCSTHNSIRLFRVETTFDYLFFFLYFLVLFQTIIFGCVCDGGWRGLGLAGRERSCMHMLHVVLGRPQQSCRKASPAQSPRPLHQQYLSRFTGWETVDDPTNIASWDLWTTSRRRGSAILIRQYSCLMASICQFVILIRVRLCT